MKFEAQGLDAGGKPSTWWPPGKLVEQIAIESWYNIENVIIYALLTEIVIVIGYIFVFKNVIFRSMLSTIDSPREE